MADITLAGLAAGFVGTLVLSIVMAPAMRGQPSTTAVLLSRLNGRPPAANARAGVALHWLYGLAWGVVLAWGVDAWVGIANASGAFVLAAGLALGAALWLVAQGFWIPVAGLDRKVAQMPRALRRRMAGLFLGFHLLYGGAAALTLVAMQPAGGAPRLGMAVPAAGLALLALALLFGAVVHLGHAPRGRAPGRPA